VKILGQVAYEELPPLYAAASLFLFPSICESFPNILLEALAAGVPVLSSNACSMPEIAGDAALYFDARSPAQIAERIASVWGNDKERLRLGEAGVRQAAKYSWNQTAEELLAVLQAAAQGSAGGAEIT
jgi:glycosyltransferase involved in cell wall biosynthesis